MNPQYISLDPVSYTHLDVYKRQDYDELERIGSVRSCRDYYLFYANEFNAIYAHYGQAAYAPVSYTHLDVYKRQEGNRQRDPQDHAGALIRIGDCTD